MYKQYLFRTHMEISWSTSFMESSSLKTEKAIRSSVKTWPPSTSKSLTAGSKSLTYGPQCLNHNQQRSRWVTWWHICKFELNSATRTLRLSLSKPRWSRYFWENWTFLSRRASRCNYGRTTRGSASTWSSSTRNRTNWTSPERQRWTSTTMSRTTMTYDLINA